MDRISLDFKYIIKNLDLSLIQNSHLFLFFLLHQRIELVNVLHRQGLCRNGITFFNSIEYPEQIIKVFAKQFLTKWKVLMKVYLDIIMNSF